MIKLGCSLRDLYRTLEEPGANPLRDAQAALDSAVRAAYGMNPAEDPLAFLLQLHHACAEMENCGGKITSPGLPLPKEDHAAFITDDCVRVEKCLWDVCVKRRNFGCSRLSSQFRRLAQTPCA